MSNVTMLSGELSLWSAVMIGQGEKAWAELLDRSATKISRGIHDEGTAASLRLYALAVGQNKRGSFQTLLEKAADHLAAPSAAAG